MEENFLLIKQISEIKELISVALMGKRDFIPFEITYKISNLLLSSNNKEILEFHYDLIKNEANKELYYDLRSSFMDRPIVEVEEFLLKKYSTETNITTKADIIQILGTLGSSKISPIAKVNINSEIRDIRYRCIIVLGWVGNKKDLPILNERLVNEPDDELRGYAATAMREIWFKKRAASENILPYLYSALVKENSEETLSMIITVIQDLLKRRFGLQERINEGIITGDPLKAKEKIIQKLGLK